MQQSKQIFTSGLDADSADWDIAKGRWVNMRNMRIGSTDRDASNTTSVEAVGGTDAFPITLPAGTNYVLGSCYDEAGDRILRFVWNSNGSDGIFCLYPDGTQYTVLLAADVTGGLGFSKYSCIHSCFVLNGNLYWTDSTNQPPRRINIDAGINLYSVTPPVVADPYTSPLSQAVISWIRRPPGLPILVAKVVDSGYPNNFIRYESFLITYRYQYRDYELSALSSDSPLLPYNDNNDTTTNRINATIPIGEKIDQDVLQIDMVALYLNQGVGYIIRSWNKTIAADAAAIAAHNAGTTALTYAFYADQTGIALSSAYVNKLFDSVPLYAETCERARNRTFLGDYTIGYDTPVAATSLVPTIVESGNSASGGIIGPVVSASAITGVSIGGAPVAYVTGSPLPVGTLQLGTFSTTNIGPSVAVVISVAGPCSTVRVRYSTDGVSFTNIDQAYVGDGNYTFPSVPINPNDGTFLTWICALLN